MNRFKASIIRRGAEAEHVYGYEADKLLKRALKKLNKPLPSTEPNRVILYQHERTLSGNLAIWKELRVVEYSQDNQK